MFKKKIKIIEDTAEAIGLKYKKKMCGSYSGSQESLKVLELGW